MALLFATNLTAQVFNVKISGDFIEVNDVESTMVPEAVDFLRWEYIFHGDCHNQRTGKLEPAPNYIFDLNEELEDGFMVQKIWWFGRYRPDGSVKWTQQTSTCYRRAEMTCNTDTIYSQPLNLTIPYGTQTPDWFTVSGQGNTFKAEQNFNHPGNVNIQTQVVINSAGYIMSGPLPPGLYYLTQVFEWQGMVFIETDNFTIF